MGGENLRRDVRGRGVKTKEGCGRGEGGGGK